MSELNCLTIAEAARRIASRDLSPMDLTKACLDRIDAVDDRLVSFVTVTAERALAEAKRAESEIMASGPRSPLHGIPYSLKDIFETKDVRTTAQSRLLAENVPDRDCTCQTKLAAVGAILLGKNTTFEFAHGGPSWDVIAPPAHNPWNLEHTTAGSSSGSAAAIAAGLTLAALGSDTGGSIRGPAAACGVAGLKPTYGRVSRRGVYPNSFSYDHVGPMAWTVEDVALLLHEIAGHDPEDPASVDRPVPDYAATLNGGVRGLIIGVPRRWLSEDAPPSAATMAAFESALDVFRGLGAVIRDVELPPLQDFEASKKIIAMSDLFAIHAENLRSQPEMFGQSLRQRIIAGGLIRAEDYVVAQRARRVLAAAMQEAMAEMNVIMLPTAEPAGKLVPGGTTSLFTRVGYCTAFNVGGNPALSLCSGFAENGMPFSLQIAGHYFDEATVLRVGHAYEQATNWRSMRPVIEGPARPKLKVP